MAPGLCLPIQLYGAVLAGQLVEDLNLFSCPCPVRRSESSGRWRHTSDLFSESWWKVASSLWLLTSTLKHSLLEKVFPSEGPCSLSSAWWLSRAELAGVEPLGLSPFYLWAPSYGSFRLILWGMPVCYLQTLRYPQSLGGN